MKKLLLLAAALALAGCVYKGAKVTEGTDLAVGVTVPGSEGALTLDALNYLTGFRLGVAENAALKVKYTCAETNSYFGCITTCIAKTIDAKVEPCVNAAEEEDKKLGSASDGSATVSTPIQIDARYNDAIAAATPASKAVLSSLGNGLGAVLDLMVSKKDGKVNAKTSDGKDVVVECSGGQCSLGKESES